MASCASQPPNEGGGGGPDLSCADATCAGGCRGDGDCAVGLHCDLVSGTCLGCVADRDCPAGKLCDTRLHTCTYGCSESHGCLGGLPCDLDAGLCVECSSDADCFEPGRPRCDPARRRCVACLPATQGEGDRCGRGHYCAEDNGDYSCQPGCTADADCGVDGGAGGGVHCDLTRHQCVGCLGDTDCADGMICQAGACVPGCSNVHGCQGGLTCCAGQCVDPTSDAQNCGRCGGACNPGWNCCNSTCSNPTNELMNCGACGQVCSVAHGTPRCAARACGVAACDAGWGNCNGVYDDGCETHLDTNIGNCGACGNACSIPKAFPKCVGGACAIDACLYPWDDCNQDLSDGCETNTNKDAANCGACGQVCKLPNAVAACQQGVCQVASCAPGFADCNGAAHDGCEAAVTSDVLNCGGCGMVCGGANAQPTCAMGLCALHCVAGWADCDMRSANGCEAFLDSDGQNCGGCGVVCTGAHAQETCGSGHCRVNACDFGWADCNGDPRDGCEASLLNDAQNCGVCKAQCSNNHISVPSCGIGLCNGQCDPGFADCDNNLKTDGCETSIAADANNCGGCGVACPAPANGSAGCSNGKCGIASCNANFGDCDKVAGNGCEASLLTDVNNCGACGNVCPQNMPRCSGGACNSMVMYVGNVNVGNLYQQQDPFTQHNTACNNQYPGSHQCTFADVTNQNLQGQICNAGNGYIIVNDMNLARYQQGYGWYYYCYGCNGGGWGSICNGQPVPCCR